MAEGKDTHTVTNPQTSQGENGNPIQGPTHPLPKIKAAQVNRDGMVGEILSS